MSLIDKFKKVFTEQPTSEMVLYGEEAEEQIDNQNNILRSMTSSSNQISNAIPKMERRITEIDQNIIDTKKDIEETKKNITQEMIENDPDISLSYKRQMVLYEDKLTYLNETKLTLLTSLKKTELVMKEAELAGGILQERIKDAKVCYAMSGQVKMIGGALAAFGKMANKTKNGAESLSVGIDGLQKSINEIYGNRLTALNPGDTK